MNQAKVAAIFASGLVLGGAGAYWAVASHKKASYEALLEDEIQQVKDHYKTIHKKERYPSPKERLEELDTEEAYQEEIARQDAQEAAYHAKISAYSIEQERITGQPNEADRPATNYSTSVKNPGGEMKENKAIYPITFEEFDGEELEYSKNTVTYFKADDTVADEIDDVIIDVEKTLGPDGLGHFGVKDPDNPDVAYIRNHNLRADYEVLVDEGAYTEIFN